MEQVDGTGIVWDLGVRLKYILTEGQSDLYSPKGQTEKTTFFVTPQDTHERSEQNPEIQQQWFLPGFIPHWLSSELCTKERAALRNVRRPRPIGRMAVAALLICTPCAALILAHGRSSMLAIGSSHLPRHPFCIMSQDWLQVAEEDEWPPVAALLDRQSRQRETATALASAVAAENYAYAAALKDELRQLRAADPVWALREALRAAVASEDFVMAAKCKVALGRLRAARPGLLWRDELLLLRRGSKVISTAVTATWTDTWTDTWTATFRRVAAMQPPPVAGDLHRRQLRGRHALGREDSLPGDDGVCGAAADVGAGRRVRRLRGGLGEGVARGDRLRSGRGRARQRPHAARLLPLLHARRAQPYVFARRAEPSARWAAARARLPRRGGRESPLRAAGRPSLLRPRPVGSDAAAQRLPARGHLRAARRRARERDAL